MFARKSIGIVLAFSLLVVFGCGKEKEKPKSLPQAYPESLPKEIISEKDGAEMILIPAGKFRMGDNELGALSPAHTVYLDAFYMDKYEVTIGQYKEFKFATGPRVLPGWMGGYSDKHPVRQVSWHDAQAYCKWAGKRLPTEAEWEKAARGGLVGKKYPWGDKLSHDNANYMGRGGRDQWDYDIAPVGTFPANDYGLYDMAGNVWEWCFDAFEYDYYMTGKRNIRVVRGGSCNDGEYDLRCAYRNGYPATDLLYHVGFRCCISAEDWRKRSKPQRKSGTSTTPGLTWEQEVTWTRTFGGSYNDLANSVKQTSDGGYIIAGDTESYGTNSDDVWLIKTDAQGRKQWDRTFGGADYDNATSVQQTSDGGYIIAGYTKSYGAGKEDMWLIKTNKEGRKQWERIFGEAGMDWAFSVQQASDGGYIIAGYTAPYGASKSDMWLLIKTDAQGKKQWDRTFGGVDYDRGTFVQQTSDGGYILAGWTRSSGAGEADVWLIKTDVQGKKQWDRTFGGADYDNATFVQQTSDGGYIIAGYTKSYGAGEEDMWLIKTDDEGRKQWDQTFGGAGHEEASSVQQTRDEGYILAGRTGSYGAGGWDVWLIKIKAEATVPKEK